LFSFNNDIIRSILAGYDYPWQIIPHIKSITEELISKGIDDYTLLSKGVLIGRNVTISPTAHIYAPCIIGDNTEVRHGAYIRGAVVIGKDCVIGNSSEIKNSIIMDKAQIPHFNYVGDSILGEGAHLGAGAICSNLRSDKQTVKIRSEEESIDTSLRKLGAILGDHVEVGCGTVLCPGTVIGQNSAVYPLALVRGSYPADSIIKSDGNVTPKHK
jgi:NDP-sugar pyrophosphorylase family protein